MLEVDAVSKMYRIGSTGSGSLARDIQYWWNAISGHVNVHAHKPEVNDHSKKSKTGYVWSLKDISFHVSEGDVLGIIGKNGAGKSTLLKIISKITKPTSGTIRLNGRVVSLLEVGTGFHPDLSGRENIYLNGAILGMTKAEMNRKFDEIVNFSEIERYIDTPVKRYSSGMYVRLGFAVAAHLEPEILIVDEVLAVGDFEFQQKCLGKMQDVSHQGRTVLFVSHSMPAIKQLCNKGLLLEKGLMKSFDGIDKVLEAYQVHEAELYPGVRQNIPGNQPGYFIEWNLAGRGNPGTHSCYSRDHCNIMFRFKALEKFNNCEVRFMIKYEKLVILHGTSMGIHQGFSLSRGYYNFRFSFEFPIRDAQLDVEMVFLSDRKIIDTWLSQTKLTVLDNFESHVNAGMLNPAINFTTDEEILVSNAY
jgi:lipopolysaccharide transport system ATP-binding protein